VGEYLKKQMVVQGEKFYAATRGDFEYTDIDTIRAFFEGKDITHVFHLAGAINISDSTAIFDTNIAGLYNLLTICKENRVKHFCFASGNNVYGIYKDSSYNEEDYIYTDNSNYYGLSKYVGELLIKDFCLSNGMDFACVRISDIYGPRQKHGNLIKSIVKNVLNRNSISLYGDGLRERDYIYITDVVEGLLFISKNSISGIVNLGTGKGTKVKEIVSIANELSNYECGITKIIVDKEDTTKVILDCTKLKSLGFEANVDIKTGLMNIISEELSNGKRN
jgi:UDP-glucose 4-epimerase